jgi:hypothetical protein
MPSESVALSLPPRPSNPKDLEYIKKLEAEVSEAWNKHEQLKNASRTLADTIELLLLLKIPAHKWKEERTAVEEAINWVREVLNNAPLIEPRDVHKLEISSLPMGQRRLRR